MADASVRPAGAGDVPEIARLQIEVWHTAYADLLPPDVLATATVERATAAWSAAVQRPPTGRHRVLVAQEQQWVVGFVAFGPAVGSDEAAAEPDDGARAAAEIAALLVEPRWGRRGHGSRLLAATVDLLRADGTERAQVWLPAGDRVSAGFYASAGWAPDGTARTLSAAGATLREVRYHVSLADGPAGPVADEQEAP